MKDFLANPKALIHKLVITALIGPCCFILSVILHLSLSDPVFIVISLLIMCLCTIKAIMLYRLIVNGNYDIVEGVCTKIRTKRIGKAKYIRLLDTDMNEIEILLSKSSKIIIGHRYQIYLKRNNTAIDTGSHYFNSVINGDALLGYEDLGEV